MVEISIKNSTCQVKNISPQAEQALDEQLSYLDQGVNYMYQKRIKEYEEFEEIINSPVFKPKDPDAAKRKLKSMEYGILALEKKLYVKLYKDKSFPTGLLPRVLKTLKNQRVIYTLSDRREKPQDGSERFVLRNAFPQLRYYQKDAVRAVMESGRGIIVSPTGTGKSLMVAKMIWELRVKSLIITPSKDITNHMVDILTEHFGKSKVAKLTTKIGEIDKPINIINIQALIKLDPNLLKEIDAVFIDEFHHSSADTYQEVNEKHLKDVYYRIGLTATNFRNDGSDMGLEAVLSEVLYHYTITEAINDGYLVQPEFNIIPNTIHSSNESSYQKEYKYDLVNYTPRNELIKDIVLGLPSARYTLILIKQRDHGHSLKKLIPGSVFIHGLEKDSVRQKILKDYRTGKIKCLIGTSVLGEGVDLPIANTLIMAGGGKAATQVIQNIGRILRTYPGKPGAFVYDFEDKGPYHLEQHSILRQEIYDTYKEAA